PEYEIFDLGQLAALPRLLDRYGLPHGGHVHVAEIATRVLSVLGVAYDGAETLLRQWSPSLAESTWRPTGGPSYHGGPVRIG
ncbi:hypothetical protein AB0M60_28365, partial [Micromonospora wenchangensis]